MPTDIRGLVGAPSTPYTDGQPYQLRQGRMGELIVTDFRGKYAEANSRGMLFHACTAIAGVTLPIITSTTQTYALWNPPGSGRVVELVAIELGYLSAAEVPGNLCISVLGFTGPLTATGGVPISAATGNTPISGQYGGSGPTPKSQWLSAITCSALTLTRTLGLSYETALAASTNAPFYQAYLFDGKDLLFPGQVMFLGGSVAAFAGACIVNTTFVEHPNVA
jgi:hypothetical protein